MILTPNTTTRIVRCDRVELLNTPSKSEGSDRRVLQSGPLRTPRMLHRASPYGVRSPSPDPRFHPSSAATTPTATPTPPSQPNDPASTGCIIHNPVRSSRPRIISSRITRPGTAKDVASSPEPTAQVITQIHRKGYVGDSNQGSREGHVDAEEEEEEKQEEEDNDNDDSVRDGKIAKPPGEVGRPGRGGYNLRSELRWSVGRFNKVKKYINGLVEQKLDCLQPLSKQTLAAVQDVRSMAVDKYIFLNDYHDNWAVDDFIRCHLKYRKQALQKIALGKEAADAKEELQRYRQREAEKKKEKRREDNRRHSSS
ncbi:hypothetical protein C8R42DRAFT_729396 [Lentinula raphanica]|nr:hypothetical protein C8R42DRAFT_729396 [Lentinula raphanica]